MITISLFCHLNSNYCTTLLCWKLNLIMHLQILDKSKSLHKWSRVTSSCKILALFKNVFCKALTLKVCQWFLLHDYPNLCACCALPIITIIILQNSDSCVAKYPAISGKSLNIFRHLHRIISCLYLVVHRGPWDQLPLMGHLEKSMGYYGPLHLWATTP